MPFFAITGGVLLHHRHQHGRAARRHQDRVAVHPRHRHHVAGVADAAIDRAARARLRASTRPAPTIHRRRPTAARRSGSSPIGPDDGSSEEYEDKLREAQRHASSAAGRFGAVSRGAPRRCVAVQRSAEGAKASQVGPYRVLRCQSPAIPNAIAALLLLYPRPDRPDLRTSISAGPKATRSPTC